MVVLVEIVVIILLLFVALIAFSKWKFNYWKKRNLPYLPPRTPLGNINLYQLKEKPGFILQKFYNEMKKNGWKHGGIYILTKPFYLVIDLDYVKAILTKDFAHFDDRGVYYNEKDDPLSAHLLYIGGPQWKTLRNKLNPSFTSSKIKTMFPIMADCAENLLKKVREETSIDVEKIISCFTVDNIGSCAFGLECGMFNDDSPFEFCTKKCPEMSRFSLFKLMMASMFPKAARILRVKHYPKEVSSFFLKLTRACVNYRQGTYSKQDFMQVLIELYEKRLLTIEEIAAQCLIFFLAGYETSTLATTFALYELAKNQEIQDKAREEISAVMRKHDEVTYEALLDAKYLNQIIDETMRKYPPIMYITRRCTKNYVIPNDDVTIEKGTIVIIPNYAIHYDEDYYPDPQMFEPERFNDANKTSRDHYAHLPFGEGPRICIGKRFGLMVVKVALFSLLRNFKFKLNAKTSEPLKMTVNSIILKPEGKIWLDVHQL